MIVDATVAPQDIKYPTDLDLLNTSRKKTEQIIDELYIPEKRKRKVRTYRVNATKDYLATARKKKKSVKAGKETEFGAKLSVSLVSGFAHLDRISWDAYNESCDLVPQVDSYYERYGFYPEVVITDKIYGSKTNREYLKSKGIRYSGKPLGRPPKLTPQEKRKLRNEAGFRSRIEGKFGEGKRKYDLGLVKTKTMDTSESWIAAVFFIMNLARWLRLYFFVSFFKTSDLL